jgi:hypothetical protein
MVLGRLLIEAAGRISTRATKPLAFSARVERRTVGVSVVPTWPFSVRLERFEPNAAVTNNVMRKHWREVRARTADVRM